ncbi:hypothetical protein [Xenorhabdus sp. KJ12.1]|uniref:hypothetical protein n=1 Tax=Xenorhabdus sp. KJ12.1 TaxID=1851571 RepID=UPI000C061ED4|nr:hypothetical protein [Xenorhabdus sp. KJ12.1]PHM72246.1 hypothetical protein Xekj_00524 [Xenorhabdus sp. KJ12.1]
MINKLLKKEFLERNKNKTTCGKNRYVVDNNTGGFFLVECQRCKEVYPSNECLGGGSIADSDDYNDVFCPHCNQVAPEECHNTALAWNLQQKRILELESALSSLLESNMHIIQSCDHNIPSIEEDIKNLSARVLTVKLMDFDLVAIQHISGRSDDYCKGFMHGTQNVVRLVTNACINSGIKCNFEAP